MAQKRMILLVLILIFIISKHQATNQEKVSMVYLYGNYDYISLLQRNEEAVNTVSPNYFDLNEEGHLLLKQVDQRLIQELHSKNIKITPFLSNHWNREKGRKALANKIELVDEIVSTIEKYHFDGVNIDIENLTLQDRENYIEFLRELRRRLPYQKLISVAVAANPYAMESGWQGSYDYEKLGQYADYLVIMAYDEHYEGGTCGPVSSFQFVKQSIEYALSKVDGQKIVLALPFYGRYWKEGEDYGGYGITTKQAQKLTQNYLTEKHYDVKTEGMIANITIQETDEKPIINGKVLRAGRYQIYYEDSKSISQKMDLAKRYNLKGIAAWSLGQETNEVWKAFSNYLIHAKEETKVEEQESWNQDAIIFVKERGIMLGKYPTDFAASDDLTRGEFATILTRLLHIEIVATNEEPFLDIHSHWAKDNIATIYKTGLMQGYESRLI